MKNPYQVLGLNENASPEQIRARYLLLARTVHPDRFDRGTHSAEWQTANEALIELNEAYTAFKTGNFVKEDTSFAQQTNSHADADSKSRSSVNDGETKAEQASDPFHDDNDSVASPEHGLLFKWAHLNAETQRILSLLTQEKEEAWICPLITKRSLLVRAIGCVLCLWIVVSWSLNISRLSGITVIIAALFGGYHLAKICINYWFVFRNDVTPSVVMTPRSILRINGASVWIWPLWAIEELQKTDNSYYVIKDGYTTIALKMREFRFSINIFDENHVKQLV